MTHKKICFKQTIQTIRQFIQNKSGSVLTYAALSIIPITGFAGVAIDSARGYMVRSHLSESLDAAALAAGRALTTEQAQADVSRYFDLNFQSGYMNANIDGPYATLNADTGEITVAVKAKVETSFMKILGEDYINVSASTKIKRTTRGMELALIMDNTGSMRSSSKIDTMKTAAKELVKVIYGDNETVDDVWVSVVPYVASVNVGKAYYGWLKNYDPKDYKKTEWKGCVEAREEPYDQTDDNHLTALFNPYFYTKDVDNDWPPVREENWRQNNGTGPNLGCGPAITPLTDKKSEIEAAINEMQPWHRGGTITNLGLAWGWRTISPKWRGLWYGVDVSLPLDYEEPLMDKVAIILTDGENTLYDHNGGGPYGSDYGAYGRVGWERLGSGINTAGKAKTEINSRMANVCQKMKDEGIIIYTITFRLNSTTTKNLFKNCATSSSHYFNSPSNSELKGIFQQIGGELSNLRIAE